MESVFAGRGRKTVTDIGYTERRRAKNTNYLRQFLKELLLLIWTRKPKKVYYIPMQ